ncbi:hypothetical protein T484DRAFT_1972594 [Baffinella frigidus]|nr:hypothetical protein T484DRAFT_1972594 [Cryptophyta sp. CCMP2293]
MEEGERKAVRLSSSAWSSRSNAGLKAMGCASCGGGVACRVEEKRRVRWAWLGAAAECRAPRNSAPGSDEQLEPSPMEMELAPMLPTSPASPPQSQKEARGDCSRPSLQPHPAEAGPTSENLH